MIESAQAHEAPPGAAVRDTHVARRGLVVRNAEAVPAARVPELAAEELRGLVIDAVGAGGRLAALFGLSAPGAAVRLLAVLAHDRDGTLELASAVVEGTYPALTPACQQAYWLERELAQGCGLHPEGHPGLAPVRFAAAGGVLAATVPGITEQPLVQGGEVHEVAVGPVHAGIIEPGHFRFQAHGEEVLHLEISLGYQHRGVRRALRGGPGARTIHLMETLAGDSSAAHALAYCEAVEALAGAEAPVRAAALRGIALEIERLANHTGDLGAMAGDIGFLPTASYCGRIRGDFLNVTAAACGSRFSRGWLRPGGVAYDLDLARTRDCRRRLLAAFADARVAVDLLWRQPSVMARLEETGRLGAAACNELGLVGVACRACGLERDVRFDHPVGVYRFHHIPVATWASGDVFARAYVRWLELQRSAAFVREQLDALPEGDAQAPVRALAPKSIVVALVEGWRGEICHVVETDAAGRFAHYEISDPSLHNWLGLAVAMRGQQISDFPLCNKSFNLSYCGHDL